MPFWFDKVIDPITITANGELSLALGTKTLVQLIGSASFTIYGLAQSGGNTDGVVVTFQNMSNNGSLAYNFDHESINASSQVNRFVHPGSATAQVGPLYGAITYRYSATFSRWCYLSRG